MASRHRSRDDQQKLSTQQYNDYIEQMRPSEYPMLKDTTYLDHAGTTLYSTSLMEQFAAKMTSTLYGNPHSASTTSQTTSDMIDDARLMLLQFFKANPDDFDVVFVANATAGAKLVMEAFRDHEDGFWYGYHRDSHTSLVGVREAAQEHKCFISDYEVEAWLAKVGSEDHSSRVSLFSYPAQSNMDGRRLPLTWLGDIRRKLSSSSREVYTMLDAASVVSTSPLDLSINDMVADFTVVSLYKIFGFPDLGALLVRKQAGQASLRRRYFGGGTVETVACIGESWHARKTETLHEKLEDGTLPMHSILAVTLAIPLHAALFQSMQRISDHTSSLTRQAYNRLSSLRHANGRPVCVIYGSHHDAAAGAGRQGPIISFNIRLASGAWAINTEVERLASIRNIQLRTGALCNPGGTAASLGLAPWELRRNFSAGLRCGSENDVVGGKPTGTIRISFGAMSTETDVTNLLGFIEEFFIETAIASPRHAYHEEQSSETRVEDSLVVERIVVYPIKSCAGWDVPNGLAWDVRGEGLAWDREWCLLHRGTKAALSQKRFPKMALIRPSIDLDEGCLRVKFAADVQTPALTGEIRVPLSADPSFYSHPDDTRVPSARVCSEWVSALIYKDEHINNLFTEALGVDCQLARFPPARKAGSSVRHSKASLQEHEKTTPTHIPGSFPREAPTSNVERPILLSNESPILLINRSSVNRVNGDIKQSGGKPCREDVFRANIIVTERSGTFNGIQRPYAEDDWKLININKCYFKMLGACRRCQMICVDQTTGCKNEEPFVTLAKTRRFNGKVFFGQHMCLMDSGSGSSRSSRDPTIAVGNVVQTFTDEDESSSSMFSSMAANA